MINLGFLDASVEHLKSKMSDEKWVGFDLDGTLAKYDGWKGWKSIGDPIPETIAVVKRLIGLGIQVKIFTARISKVSLARNGITESQMADVIQEWCEKNIGIKLPVTSEKDCNMVFCVDDFSVAVETNTGKAIGEGFGRFEKEIKAISKNEEVHDEKTT